MARTVLPDFLVALRRRSGLFFRFFAPSVRKGGVASEERGGSQRHVVPGRQALKNAQKNSFKSWNRSSSSNERSDFSSDASTRIFDDYAQIIPTYTGPTLKADAKIFAMGSCFAREIELALIARGGNVISVDETIERDEFRDNTGKIRSGFFHRFTPRSMAQEFRACFEDPFEWKDNALIFPVGNDRFTDLNYWQIGGAKEDLAANLVRREVAKALVRRAAEADVVILTLGLTEAWFHKPTGLYANFTSPQFLARHANDFELHIINVQDTIECLEDIYCMLNKHHKTGKFQLVVTVSPIPLSSTFTPKDVVIANMDSKSTLRAAVVDFVSRHENAHYFPSYEMATYSNTDLAWRPDRIHLIFKMTKKIMSNFINVYYERDALPEIKKV